MCISIMTTCVGGTIRSEGYPDDELSVDSEWDEGAVIDGYEQKNDKWRSEQFM